jgi:cob(I)alamin adenosyltransferase
MKGYIQVYTGNGKGKTTASIGLSVRAAGAGLKVYIAQFMKMGDYSELNSLKRFSDLIKIQQFGLGQFIKTAPSPEEIAAAKEGLECAKAALLSNDYDVVIMEEANVAVTCGLFPVKTLLDIMDMKPDHVELIITGRGAAPETIEKADLVTEMKEIKHYFSKGVMARTGIEM